jgi:small subunit ribosomal protein S4
MVTLEQKIIGQKYKKRIPKPLSDFGKGLRAKQELKELYNLREKQFKRYIKEILKSRGKKEDLQDLLIKKLESRLDNIVFRLGLALTRQQARQLVSHGHFLVNNKKVDIPSYQIKPGDKIKVKENSKNKKIFKEILETLRKYQPPDWLLFDKEKLEGEVVSLPDFEKIKPPAEVSLIFEFYSR